VAGVVGWWDETSEPEVSDALDELVRAGLSDQEEVLPTEVDKPVDEPITKEDVSNLKEKVEAQKRYVLVGGGNSSSSYTTTGTIMFSPLESTTATYTLDYVNLTGQAHRKFQEYEKALKKVDAALQQLIPKVMGLPSKEYKGLRKDLELVAKVMEEAKKQGLI